MGKTLVIALKLTTMSTHRQQEVATTHGLANEIQPPLQEQLDRRIALKLASDARNRHYAITPSLEPPRNPLASKVERAPQDLIPYEDIISMMKEQAKRIQELKQNLEHIKGDRKWDRKENRHRVRNRDDLHQYRTQ